MQYFNFRRLISKYSVKFVVLIPEEGRYEKGEYVEGEPERKEVEGAIISIKDSKVYRSDGNLTMKDKNLYMLEPIKCDLEGAKAIYKNNLYSIETCQEDFDFTGVYAYTLKYVSAFEEDSE